MAISSGKILTRTTIAPLIFLVSFLTLSHSQITPSTPSESEPTMAECGTRLLVLAPCAPFVQGQSPEPTVQCCNNLMQVYNLERGCLCLFLNGTALASLPINSTLALQLPGLCSPQIDPSTCSTSGGAAPPTSSAPPTSAPSPASPVAYTKNPTVAAGAPTVTISPSTVRFGLKNGSAYKLPSFQWGAAVAVVFLLLQKLL